jgi:hypothetical protein
MPDFHAIFKHRNNTNNQYIQNFTPKRTLAASAEAERSKE